MVGWARFRIELFTLLARYIRDAQSLYSRHAELGVIERMTTSLQLRHEITEFAR
jgi:hypothetical protein